MDYIDRYLDRQDRNYAEAEFSTGWRTANAGKAWTVNGGIGLLYEDAIGQHVRLATPAEAAGVRTYWEQAGYIRR